MTLPHITTLLARTIIVLACAAIIAQSLLLWNATGRAVLTKYVDPARTARESNAGSAGASEGQGALSDLFKDTGLEDATGALTAPPNQFALGLLPSGFDKHILSVTTLAAPAAITALLALSLSALDRRLRRAAAQE